MESPRVDDLPGVARAAARGSPEHHGGERAAPRGRFDLQAMRYRQVQQYARREDRQGCRTARRHSAYSRCPHALAVPYCDIYEQSDPRYARGATAQWPQAQVYR